MPKYDIDLMFIIEADDERDAELRLGNIRAIIEHDVLPKWDYADDSCYPSPARDHKV